VIPPCRLELMSGPRSSSLSRYLRPANGPLWLTTLPSTKREIRCDTLERLVVRVEGREALRAVLEFLHAGDVLMVTRIDRLARSIGGLQEIVRTGLAARS
jgi:hypothetical protein